MPSVRVDRAGAQPSTPGAGKPAKCRGSSRLAPNRPRPAAGSKSAAARPSLRRPPPCHPAPGRSRSPDRRRRRSNSPKRASLRCPSGLAAPVRTTTSVRTVTGSEGASVSPPLSRVNSCWKGPLVSGGRRVCSSRFEALCRPNHSSLASALRFGRRTHRMQFGNRLVGFGNNSGC